MKSRNKELNCFQMCQGVGGILDHQKTVIVQKGSGAFVHALAFVIDQAIAAGQMPDRYKRPVKLSAKTKKGKTIVFRSPMFGSSALGGRL